MIKSSTDNSRNSNHSIACFDLSGTLVDHNDKKKSIQGMEDVLRAFAQNDWDIKIVTYRDSDYAEKLFSSAYKHLANSIQYEIIETGFDKSHAIENLIETNPEKILFIDDNPLHIKAITAISSDIISIGFLGSGKFSDRLSETCNSVGAHFFKTQQELLAFVNNDII